MLGAPPAAGNSRSEQDHGASVPSRGNSTINKYDLIRQVGRGWSRLALGANCRISCSLSQAFPAGSEGSGKEVLLFKFPLGKAS